MLLEGQGYVREKRGDESTETTVNGAGAGAEEMDTGPSRRGHGVGEGRVDHIRPLPRTVRGFPVESN